MSTALATPVTEIDEQEFIDGITTGMTEQSQTVENREHHAVRASHAKSSACTVGMLEIPAGLPPKLAQSLFAKPGTYQVAVRFAQGPGETLGDRVSTHRGMAIKVFGVAGEKLPERADAERLSASRERRHRCRADLRGPNPCVTRTEMQR